MAYAFGAVMGGLVLAGDVFSDVRSDLLGDLLLGAVNDLLRSDPLSRGAGEAGEAGGAGGAGGA
jgi:hypothetical protein